MSKNVYTLRRLTKAQCKPLLSKYHYLSNISKDFKSGYNYGLVSVENPRIHGVCIFTGLPSQNIAVGAFGLKKNEQKGFFELSRLCLSPEVQQNEHNIASWFVARAIKQFKKDTYVRSILSYADSEYHTGTLYKALGFQYYGLTAKKSDFWVKDITGSHSKLSRGKTKGLKGEWRDRSRKHRFLKIFDKDLKVKWNY